MFQFLQLVSILLVALTFAAALAHALEYPGKRRLDRDTYLKVQAIYYPGFTAIGMAEPLALIAACALLLFTPFATTAFWLTALALGALLLAHAVYWVVTHPVNKVWLTDTSLDRAGDKFFAAGKGPASGDWTILRDRWEVSHVARTVLATTSFVALVVAAVFFRPA